MHSAAGEEKDAHLCSFVEENYLDEQVNIIIIIIITLSRIQFRMQNFFLSSCTRTLSDLCMRDDSLGFEDCRLATHLLNLNLV